ncbi:blastula protease 10-like [Antedon mediterranea]|uniref:blastula protease 10-like n=1 Tax=Antedon mediterranea TaxID=105859 RepID=UPI003AF8A7A2
MIFHYLTTRRRLRFGKTLAIVLHEIGHTIGFEHEHERHDRDDYVTINWINVEAENADAFEKKDTIMTVPYDIYSIMHYARDTFTINGSPTILTNDPLLQYEIGSAPTPTFLDKKLANQIYNCNAYCGYRRPCRNGGYIGPECACLCPPGFYGQQCELGAAQKIEGCRYQLTDQTGIIESSNFPNNYGNWEDCIWYIKAPRGQTITLTFLEFDLEDSPFCHRDYLGIRTKNMYKDEGNWFCGKRIPSSITTKSNELMLLFISDYMINSKGFKAKYQINNYVSQTNG